jgi:hypothetical protein
MLLPHADGRREPASLASVEPVNGDTLTIVVGVAGVVVSVLSSVIAYRRGTQTAAKQQAKLLQTADEQQAELLQATDAQKAEIIRVLEQRIVILSEWGRGVASRTATASVPTSGPAQRLPGAAGDADAGVSPSALELLVRASLGTLLNERGEVQLSRLFQEVGEALGAPQYKETEQILRQLRAAGAIDWDGPDDLSGVQAVRVLAPKRGDHLAAGVQIAGERTG